MPKKRSIEVTLEDDVYNALAALKQSESDSFGDVISKLIKEAKQDERPDRTSWILTLEKRSMPQSSGESYKIACKAFLCEYANCQSKATTIEKIQPIGIISLVCDEHALVLS